MITIITIIVAVDLLVVQIVVKLSNSGTAEMHMDMVTAIPR